MTRLTALPYRNVLAIAAAGCLLAAAGLYALLRMPPALVDQFRPAAADAVYLASILVAGLSARLFPRTAPIVGLVCSLAVLGLIASVQLRGVEFVRSLTGLADLIETIPARFGDPIFRYGLSLPDGISFSAQVLGLLSFAVATVVIGLLRAAFTGRFDRRSLIPQMQTTAGIFAVGLLLTAVLVMQYLPELRLRLDILLNGMDEQTARNNSRESLAAYASFPHVAMIILLCSLMAPRQGVDEAPGAAADTTEPKRRRENNVDTLFRDLQNFGAVMGTIGFGAGGDPNADGPADRGADGGLEGVLTARAARALGRFGMKPGQLRFEEVTKALGSFASHPEDQQSQNATPTSVLFEDTLLDCKLAPIGVLLAYHLSSGRNVILLADSRRVNELKSLIGSVLDDLLPRHFWRWSGASEGFPRDPLRSTILVGSPREVFHHAVRLMADITSRKATRPGADHDTAPSNGEAFVRDLAATAILDAHLLDTLELSRLLRLLRRIGAMTDGGAMQLMVQTEPVENAADAVRNALIGFDAILVSTLAGQPARGQRLIAWDYQEASRQGFLGPGRNSGSTAAAPSKGAGPATEIGTDPPPLFSIPFGRIRANCASVQVIDEVGDEDRGAWRRMSSGQAKSLACEVVAVGSYASDSSACFIDRDRGNLASAILRDVAAPGAGTGLLHVLSDPAPTRGTVAAAIWPGVGKTLENQSFEDLKQRLAKYLPRIPQSTAGINEMFQDIALSFLSGSGPVPSGDLQIIATRYLGEQFTDGALSTLGLPNLRSVLSAQALDTYFSSTGRKGLSFEQIGILDSPVALDSIECRDPARLMEIAFQQMVTPENAGFSLPAIDRGLMYDDGSRIVVNGTRYKVSISGTGHVTASVETASAGIDGRWREVFARSYALKGLACGSLVVRGSMSAFGGLATYHRKTPFKASLALVRPLDQVTATKCDAAWPTGLAEFSGLRLPIASGQNVAGVAAALCLSLQDVLELKFPAVAHRLAVVSPQVQDAHKAENAVSSHRLCRLDRDGSADALATLRVSLGDQNNGGAGGQAIEILALEDSDTTLGVARMIHDAFAQIGNLAQEDTIVEVWRAHLATLETGSQAQQPAAMFDWKGAKQVLGGPVGAHE